MDKIAFVLQKITRLTGKHKAVMNKPGSVTHKAVIVTIDPASVKS